MDKQSSVTLYAPLNLPKTLQCAVDVLGLIFLAVASRDCHADGHLPSSEPGHWLSCKAEPLGLPRCSRWQVQQWKEGGISPHFCVAYCCRYRRYGVSPEEMTIAGIQNASGPAEGAPRRSPACLHRGSCLAEERAVRPCYGEAAGFVGSPIPQRILEPAALWRRSSWRWRSFVHSEPGCLR